jgi:RNA polymerase sigma factor for flagellar operon FliA
MSALLPSLPSADVAADEDEVVLWDAFKKEGMLSARQKLFSRHAAFARNIARRFHRERSRGDIEMADLVQLAYAGLLEALDKFDPKYGIPFRPFAAYRISGSIRDGIVKMSERHEQLSWRYRIRRERLRSLVLEDAGNMNTSATLEALADIAIGLALGFMLEGTGLFEQGNAEQDESVSDATAYDSLVWKETLSQLQATLSSLPEREQVILRQHYQRDVSFDHLAALMGITKGRVSQLHRAALQVLRKRMRERGHFRLER